jgi:cytochrome P450 family 135
MPPEIEGSPVSQTIRWLRQPIQVMEEGRKRHGEVFGLRFLTAEAPMYVVSDPKAVKAVYSEPANRIPPERAAQMESLMGSRSILLQEGPQHLARRKLMLPPFHGERMRSHESIIRATIEAEMERWQPGHPLAIHSRMLAVSLDVILRAVFGVVEGPRLERMRMLLERLLVRTARSGEAVRDEVVDLELYAEIADRRAVTDLGDREDILSMLIEARFADGEAMSDAELRDQLMTLLVAGHETTATALAWTFELLVRNPYALRLLREEIDAGEDDSYLRAVIAESLRLRPVIPIVGRLLSRGTEVDGYRLPAGTHVAPAIWLTHTRADIYPEPFRFRPERFLTTPPDTYAWIPYGGGVRRCLGAAFAEFEMRIVLTEVLRRFDLVPENTTPSRLGRRGITLFPQDGVPLVVMRRDPAAAAPRGGYPA